MIPFGKARLVLESEENKLNTLCIITYGMGVYWALNGVKEYKSNVEIIDLRTINPIDETTKMHIRNLDVYVSRITEEMKLGREEVLQQVRTEIKLLARLIAAQADGSKLKE